MNAQNGVWRLVAGVVTSFLVGLLLAGLPFILSTRDTADESDVAGLQVQLGALEVKIARLEVRLDDIEADIAEIHTTITGFPLRGAAP